MTYRKYREFEFTAFSGADFLGAGVTQLSCGDSFQMPASATSSIKVKDNDSCLSSNAYCKESGDDRSGQTADIELNGKQVGGGVKIYAECYTVLQDSDGNHYFLIEIQAAGSASDDRNDLFAFYDSVPLVGTELTVVSTGHACGNRLQYKKLSAGLTWDADGDGKITIEAEDMALSGYRVDDIDDASGGEVIKLKKKEGEASVTFGAENGVYDLEIAYVDENDGQGSIVVEVNGVVVQTILLTQGNNGRGNDHSTISTIVIDSLDLSQGDTITLRGTRDRYEFARIDALTFHANNAPAAQQLASVAEDHAPIAEDDAFSIGESALVVEDILGNDSDADGDAITILGANGVAPNVAFTATSTGGRDALIIVAPDGALNFAADTAGNFEDLALGETDTITITYTISDGDGGTDTADVIVTINGENDDPTAVSDSFVTSESELVVEDILGNDSDVDGSDALTIISAGGNAPGSAFTTTSAGNRNASVIFAPDGALNFAADTGGNFEDLSEGETDTILVDYTVSDGSGGTSTATVSVTIDGENDGPAAEDDAFNVDEGALLVSDLLGNDSDVDANDVVQILEANGTVVNTAFTVTSIDGRQALAIVASSGSANIAVDQLGNFEDLALGETDTVLINYIVTDGNGATDTATATITIEGANDDPEAEDDAFSIDEGALFTGNILANDSDIDASDSITITSANGGAVNSAFTVISAGGREAFAIVAPDGALNIAVDQLGNFEDVAIGETDIVSIAYTVTDGNGATDTATATITIDGQNDDPDAIDDVFSFVASGIEVGNLLLNDSDIDASDGLQITSADGNAIDSALGGATLFNVTSTGGREAEMVVSENFGFNVAFNPTGEFLDLGAGETDTVTFTYDITDNNGGTDTALVTITVDGENDGPTAEDDAFVIAEDEFLVVDILGNDSDVDATDVLSIAGANGNAANTAFTVTSAGGREGFAIVAVGGPTNLAFDQLQAFADLALGETDTVTFTYDISDGNGGTDSADAVITVVGDGEVVVTGTSTFDTPNTGQEVSISLNVDSTTVDGTADASIDINFGAVLQPQINVVYVVDTSDSTVASVLDQEKAALEALTADIATQGFAEGSVSISIVPFSTTAGPDGTGDGSSTFTLDTTDDAGSSDLDDINAALEELTGGGFTNYIDALGEASDIIGTLDPTGSETNLVFFLSDGLPTVLDPATGSIITQSEADIAAAAAPLQAVAQISAFEIGDVDALQFLDALDNTGGAQSVSDPSDLSDALVSSPIPEGTVIGADLFSFDDSETFGTLVNVIEVDVPGDVDDPENPNLVETPLGLELDLTLSGLAADLGDANRIALVVQFDDDGDGVVDLALTTEVDVFGLA